MVRSILASQIEEKVTFVSGDAVSVTASGQVVSLTGNLARGDGAINNVTGNKLQPKRLRMRFTYSTAQVFSTVRMLLFQWQDAAVPVPNGILQYIGDARAPASPILWTNHTKVIVKADVVKALEPKATGGSDACYFDVDIRRFAPIMLDSSTLNPQMNGLYFLIISDDIIGTAPQFTYTTELVYTDA